MVSTLLFETNNKAQKFCPGSFQTKTDLNLCQNSIRQYSFSAPLVKFSSTDGGDVAQASLPATKDKVTGCQPHVLVGAPANLILVFPYPEGANLLLPGHLRTPTIGVRSNSRLECT